jgi:hypothetical protein
MITCTKEQGGERLSLAFAAFPEIFNNKNRSPIESIYYGLIHLGHSLIKLESLYRYLRKFDSFDQRRYVLLSTRHIPAALLVLLSLEFVPRRRHRRQRPRTTAGDNTLAIPAEVSTSDGKGHNGPSGEDYRLPNSRDTTNNVLGSGL